MTTATRLTVPVADIRAIGARYNTDYDLTSDPAVETVRRWATGLRADADDSSTPNALKAEAGDLDALARATGRRRDVVPHGRSDAVTTMADGSPRLPDGTYIRYREGNGIRRYAQISGTDDGRTKYKIANRVGGWGEWIWSDAGAWVFPNQVEVVSEEEATELVTMEFE